MEMFADVWMRRRSNVSGMGYIMQKNKEELNIQFLVEEGLVRLEDGSAFDLHKEIKALLAESDKKVRVHEKAIKIGKIVEIIIMLTVLAAVLMLVIL